ncbi:hypothetical protein KUTeg_010219 [Tegillarca granosa]|uniref:Carbonic anhydrase n=1 Tax=Tegillarca granosa TaxID=220873 RepID=A0ABQ9F639_TEGGR|nr:hypothetical protein KUTeg_010219 [Tegillarca granosa]
MTQNPYRWPLVYPLCAGRAQSPVAIDTSDVDYDSSLGRFSFNGYETIRNVQTSLQNNGHTVEVDLTGRPIAIRGGGLEGIYRVKQFHFHWGATDRRGSEHEINGYHYPMEMHIVHYATRFGNYEAAQSQRDGLAVLAFFLSGDTIPLDSFPLASILPRNMRDFYRYRGSLTTPPCYESVVWTIFKTPEEISEFQLTC